MKLTIDQLFTEKKDKNGTRFTLNNTFPLNFKGEREAAQFLVQAIRFWKTKGVFLHETPDPEEGGRSKDPASIPDDKLVLGFRMFRGEPNELADVPVVALMDKILPKFKEYSFVEEDVVCDCGCGHIVYRYPFSELLLLAEGGPEAIAAKEQREQEEARKENIRRLEDSVTEALKGVKVSDANRKALVQYRSQEGHWNKVKVISPDVVVCNADRHEYGGSGGVGMFCQARVWYKGQTQMKEWQWRDRYNPSADDPSMVIHDIGKVTTSPSSNGKIEIKVQLINTQHGNRSTSFSFEDKAAISAPVLNTRDQAAFVTAFGRERDRILGAMKELWPKKSQMLTSRGPSNYWKPSIKQQVCDAEHGIGAFVTEEQIDHRGEDRQIRYELFVLSAKQPKAKRVLEDHGYQDSEGSRVISIVELTPEAIVTNTTDGPKTVKLS